MLKILKLIIIIIFSSFYICRDYIIHKNECLNIEDFENFYYNDNLYILPDNYSDIYSHYNFYGPMHKIGYTIGAHNKVIETYVLDNDIENNILFQKDGRYFWFKEGFEFPNMKNINISKLLVLKYNKEGLIVEENEFLLKDILLSDLLIEYTVNDSKDSFLADNNNFLKYGIRYIYENGIITEYSEMVTIYNKKLFIKRINEKNERVIYILNEEYSSELYEFVLNNF